MARTGIVSRKRRPVSRDPPPTTPASTSNGASPIDLTNDDILGDSSKDAINLASDTDSDDVPLVEAMTRETSKSTTSSRSASRSRSSSPVDKIEPSPNKKPRLSSPAASDASEPSAAAAPKAVPEDMAGLFFFDDAPKVVKKKALWQEDGTSTPDATASKKEGDGLAEDSLVLPSHVIVEAADERAADGDMDVTEEGAVKPLTEAEVFADDLGKIEFLDGTDDRPVQRYFDIGEDGEPVPVGKQHIVCSICKERGHVQRECKLVICLTCGARDEHETRNCPVALICFACGGRGHRSKECPAPRHQRQYRHAGPMCDRCGSDVHPANNCPTLWRIYSYLAPDDRKATLAVRTQLSEEGGFEGDVLVHNPDDEEDGWCYNCAGDDHYGDDCPEPRISRAPRPDFSAFSSYNSHNSPFWTGPSMSKRPPRPKRHNMRPTAAELVVPDVMENVGWRGKQREKQKAMDYEKARAAANGDDDEGGSSWFDRPSVLPSRADFSIKGRGASKKEETAKAAKKRSRKERRTSDEKGWSREEDSFVSGGSGTQLEAEYGLDYESRSPPSKSGFGGNNRSRSNSTRSDVSNSRGSQRGSKPDPPKQFSFKFGGGPAVGSASGIRPSTFARMNGDSRSSPQQSASNSNAGSSSSSFLKRIESTGGGPSGSKGKKSALEPLTRADLRDAQRKEKERHEEVNSLLSRLGKKGGRTPWMDSPDRRGAGGGGGGGGGRGDSSGSTGTSTPQGGRSRYQGGYR